MTIDGNFYSIGLEEIFNSEHDNDAGSLKAAAQVSVTGMDMEIYHFHYKKLGPYWLFESHIAAANKAQ